MGVISQSIAQITHKSCVQSSLSSHCQTSVFCRHECLWGRAVGHKDINVYLGDKSVS